MPSDCSCLELSASKLDLYLAVDDCSCEPYLAVGILRQLCHASCCLPLVFTIRYLFPALVVIRLFMALNSL